MIDGRPWLSWSINARDINMISYLCRRRQKDVADYIITDEKLSGELLKLLLSSDCPRYKFTVIYRRHIHKTYYCCVMKSIAWFIYSLISILDFLIVQPKPGQIFWELLHWSSTSMAIMVLLIWRNTPLLRMKLIPKTLLPHPPSLQIL